MINGEIFCYYSIITRDLFAPNQVGDKIMAGTLGNAKV